MACVAATRLGYRLSLRQARLSASIYAIAFPGIADVTVWCHTLYPLSINL